MRPKTSAGWDTPLGRFIEKFRATRLIQELRGDPATAVTVNAAYNWVHGTSRPRIEVALRISQLSGLPVEDVYSRRRVRRGDKG